MTSTSVHPPVTEPQNTGINYHHEWRAPGPGDSRSPCPALNALANHGYLPRDGKNISVRELISTVKTGYGLSTPFAVIVTIGALAVLRRFRNISLHDIGYRGRIEHKASLVHDDTPPEEDYATSKVNKQLLDDFIAGAGTGRSDVTDLDEDEGSVRDEGKSRVITVLDAVDLARARIRRETESQPLDGRHARIAMGEMSAVLGIFGVKSGERVGVPVEYIRDWFGEDRLPQGWKPTHVEGLITMLRRSRAFRKEMESQREVMEAKH